MFDYLVEKVHHCVSQLADNRESPDYDLPSAIMSGLAVFGLKAPSLLSFVENYEARKENLEQIYKIQDVPTPKGLRKILDPINPNQLLPTFKAMHEEESVAALLKEQMVFSSLGGYLAIAADGTHTFVLITRIVLIF